MGLVGAMKNAAKVAGPVCAGILIHWIDYSPTFRLMGLLVLVGAALVLLGASTSQKSASKRGAAPVTSAASASGTGRR